MQLMAKCHKCMIDAINVKYKRYGSECNKLETLYIEMIVTWDTAEGINVESGKMCYFGLIHKHNSILPLYCIAPVINNVQRTGLLDWRNAKLKQSQNLTFANT